MADDDTPDEATRRTYESPLRERQAQQTREQILDALTDLLADKSPDEVNTRELARAAGVSERTVYRHFPDRAALVEGLSVRLAAASGRERGVEPRSLEDLKPLVIALMADLEQHHVEARAEALFNADPRRYSEVTRGHTGQFREAVDASMPDLSDDQREALTAVIRVLLSAQAWLRLREEFGIGGEKSGPIVAWVVDAISHEVQRGNPPPS